MQNKVRNNLVYLLLYQTLVVIFPIITTPIVSRALGDEILGVYSYTYSIAYYFSLFATLGISTYGARTIAQTRDDKKLVSSQFWELYSIQIVLSIITAAIYVIYCITIGKTYCVTALLQGTTIVMAFLDITWFFTGIEEFKTMVLRNVFIKIVSLVLIVIFVKDKSALNWYVLILNLSNALGQIAIWPTALRIVGKPRFLINKIKVHMPFVWKLFIPILALNLSLLVDKVMLGSLSSMNNVGYYENIDKIVKMPIGLSMAVTSVLSPRASYDESHGNSEQNKMTIVKTMEVIWMLAIPIVGILIAISDKLVPWYLGNDFLPCKSYLKWIAVVILFIVSESILRLQYYVPKGKDKIYIKGVLWGSVINIVINVLMIKNYGVYGVIWGTLACELFGMVYLFMNCRLDIKWVPLFKTAVYFVIASLIMFVCIYCVSKNLGATPLTTIIQLLTGISVYGLMIGGGIVARKITKKN